MKKLYPIKFTPYLKETAWGSESWEIADISGVTSVASNGFLKDNDLADILETYMGDFVGDNVFDYHNIQFPLLIKYLNIRDRLSVQVHPSDEIAGERYYSYGKTEAWYVMDAKPEAEVYMGFKRDTSAEEFYAACKAGTAQDLMNCFHPKKGDFFFIEAGTVHAAGGGITIAEVQESSDITFRLYDWGRENNPETRREMHLDIALDCIDFNQYKEDLYYSHCGEGVQQMAKCKHFTMTSLPLPEAVKVDGDEVESFIIYMCTAGAASIQWEGEKGTETLEFKSGETVIVPATLEEFVLQPSAPGTHLVETHIDYIDEADGYFDEE